MRIINTLNQIRSCFMNQEFDLDKWEIYAEEISPFLVDLCKEDIRTYDFEKEVLPVIDQVMHDTESLKQLETSFQNVCAVLERNLSKLFEQNPAFDLILYLGLCNGAGWATKLGMNDTVLLGVEKIIEQGRTNEQDLKGQNYQEIGHIWHFKNSEKIGDLKVSDNFVNQFHEEGIAMVCEQILCSDPDFYHQDKEGWLLWCKENETVLKKEILYRVENGLSLQDFFGDWCAFMDHSDTGYFIGCQFIRGLLDSMSLNEIAVMEEERIKEEFIRYLKSENQQR